jgi:hypothetical protein
MLGLLRVWFDMIENSNENKKMKTVAFCETNSAFQENIIPNSLLNYLPKYMIPHKYYFIDELPTTGNVKKIDKK